MSTKRVDYCISAVRCNEKHVELVKIHKASGDTIKPPIVCSRERIVSLLDEGYKFVTILKNSRARWTKGEDVQIVKLNGIKYIRTDKNEVASDNLENLPGF